MVDFDDWLGGYPPPTKSEINHLFIFMKGPRTKPSLSTVTGPGIPPTDCFFLEEGIFDGGHFLYESINLILLYIYSISYI